MACLMMLERVNYLISTEVQLPVEEMADRIADIMFAAFGLTISCPDLPHADSGLAPADCPGNSAVRVLTCVFFTASSRLLT